ncbi:mCG144663, partial [Mus musculus]
KESLIFPLEISQARPPFFWHWSQYYLPSSYKTSGRALLTMNGSSSPKFQSLSTVLPKTWSSCHRNTPLLVPICLSQDFYSCTNIMTRKQVGEERVYSTYTSILLFITKGIRTGTQAG